MYDLQEIRKNYRGFTDARIVHIAQKKSKGLPKEVLPILTDELRRRNLGEDLISWVQVETRELSIQERTTLQEIIRSCLCESCDKNTNLRGYRYDTLVGALLIDFDTSRTSIVCSKCGSKDAKRSFYISLLFGWWSLPSIIRMPFLLFNKINDYIKRDEISEEIINSLISDNIGRIRLSDDEEEEIKVLLHEFNQAEEDQFTDVDI